MRIKNRLTPYPILDDYGDDYIDSHFSVEYDVKVQFSEVYGKLSFNLENDDIKKLIYDGKAEYAAHIECSSTYFRKIITSREKEIEFKLDMSNISRVIEIRTFIILKEDVANFSSDKFHPDYEGETFNLKAHQMIAIGTAKNFNVERDDRDLESFPSILKIVKSSDKKKGTLTVDTDRDNYILIGLNEEIYELYARLGKTTFKHSAFTLVLFPALVVVLQRMHDNKDNPDMNSRHWFQVINSILNNNGFSINNISLDNESLLSVCQSIFADPISKSFKELDSVSERM